MKLFKKVILISSVKFILIISLVGVVIAFLLGGFNLLISILPQIPEMGLAYDTADNFYSVPVKTTNGIGTVYSPLSDFKTYDENAKTLANIKINGVFLANKKLKIVDKYLFMSSFKEEDFESLLSSKIYYKVTQTGITVGGSDNIDRTTYIFKNSFYSTGTTNNSGSTDGTQKLSDNFTLYSGYDSTKDSNKFMADNLNFLMRTQNSIPYFYFNFEHSKHFGFLYPYRMSYGIILQNAESLNINTIKDYSITDTVLSGPFNLFSNNSNDSIVQSMTVCEEQSGEKVSPTCYIIPKQDTFEEGNRFYFKNNELLGKEKDFESIYNIKYTYFTISGQKYISQITAIPKTFNIDNDYISILDKSFFKNSGGRNDIIDKNYTDLTTTDKEYLISESMRIMPKYFYIDNELRTILSKNDNDKTSKYDFKLTDKNIVLDIHPYLLIHSFYQSYITDKNSSVKIRSTGFNTSNKVLDTYSYLNDVGQNTISQLSSFSDGGFFPYTSDTDNLKMKKDFQKNLDLIISGFDYKKMVTKNANPDGAVPVVLISHTPKPKDSTFMGLWNEEIAGIDYGFNLITVYNLFHHPGLEDTTGNTQQEAIKNDYINAFNSSTGTTQQPQSFWGQVGDFVNSSVDTFGKLSTYMTKRIMNPFQSISDDVSDAKSSYLDTYRNYSCDYGSKFDKLKADFNSIKETVKENYGNEQIERILSILTKNGISFLSLEQDKSKKIEELTQKNNQILQVVGEFNNEQDAKKKQLIQQELNTLRKEVQELQQEIDNSQEGTTKKIDDIIKTITDKISLKTSFLQILREKSTAVQTNSDQINKTMSEIASLKSDLADLNDVKENYQTDINKTFDILISFQKYNELLKEMTVMENCLITGNNSMDYVKQMNDIQTSYQKSYNETDGRIKGYEKTVTSKYSELSDLTKNMDINNEEQKTKILTLNTEIEDTLKLLKKEQIYLNNLRTGKSNQINTLIEKYGTDNTIVLNYRNDKTYNALIKERQDSNDKVQKETIKKIQDTGNSNANILKGYFDTFQRLLTDYKSLKSQIDGLDVKISELTDKINTSPTQDISKQLEDLNNEKLSLQVKMEVIDKEFNNTKNISGLSDIGNIDNLTQEFIDSKLSAVKSEQNQISSYSGVTSVLSGTGDSLLFNSTQKDFMNHMVEEEFKKQVLEDFKTGNFEHYYIAYSQGYELSQELKNKGMLDTIFKSVGTDLNDIWSYGGNKDLALYYNLHVFYKGIFDLKSELDNNENIVNNEVYPLQKLNARFGTFGRFFFPNISEGEFIIDNVSEFEQMSGLKLSLSQNAERIQLLQTNLRTYINSMSLDGVFTGSGYYADLNNFGSGKVYKEILNETNIRFIKSHSDIFGYSSGMTLSGNLNENLIVSVFTDNALNMQQFYKDVSIHGFEHRIVINENINNINILSGALNDAIKKGDLVNIATIGTALSIYKNQYNGMITQDLDSFNKYYVAYLMSIYRKLLIAKFVDGYESSISSDLLLPNEEAKKIYNEIISLQQETIDLSSNSESVLNGQKKAFNKQLETYKSKICGNYSDSNTKSSCINYIDYLEKKPDVKSFLEEIEYSSSITKMVSVHGRKYPRTSDTSTYVRPDVKPYDSSNGGLVGQCVWYIQVVKNAKGGNASSWGAQGTIVPPKGDFLSKINKGDVVVFSIGEYGHIAIVENVDQQNNKVTISESNYGTQGKITIRTIPADSWLIKHYIIGIRDKYLGVN